MPSKVARMNKAKVIAGSKDKDITVEEFKQFRLMLLAGKLHTANGVRGTGGLWSNTKRGHLDPPNFGKYMSSTRFREIFRWSRFAFASDAEINRKDDDQLKDRSFDMVLHRRENLKKRAVVDHSDSGIKMIVDERMMPWIPSQSPKAGAPHCVFEDRKPDPYGEMTKNGADPDHWIELAAEECDNPVRMRAKEWDATYGATVSTTLRLIKEAGGTKVNKGELHGDGWFTSVKLAQAMAIEFPGWSVTGIVKNNSAGFPKAFLTSFCGSRSGHIRPAGFNAWMTCKLPDGTIMLAIGHNTEEGATKLLLSTAGTGACGQDYVQSWNTASGKAHKSVARPEQFTNYYRVNGVIDSLNRQHNFEVRLFDSWPVKDFWKKNFTKHEGIVFTEMYLCMRQNGYLESFTGSSGEVESVLQFLDRFIGAVLKPVKVSTVVLPSPVKRDSVGRPLPRPTSRGEKRNLSMDGAHSHGNMKKAKKGGGLMAIRGACQVCVQQKRRMKDRQKSLPQTRNYCEYCEAFVHGRRAGRAGSAFNGCWDFHIHHKVHGMYRSGEGM